MSAIKKARNRGWLLLGSLLLLLLIPLEVWGQDGGTTDPPAETVPRVRYTKNGTLVAEGDPPAQRRKRGPRPEEPGVPSVRSPKPAWNHDTPPPVAQDDPPSPPIHSPGEPPSANMARTVPSSSLETPPETIEAPLLSTDASHESSTLVLHSGSYRILSVVGPPSVGMLQGRGAWQLYGRMQAAQEVMSLQEAMEVPAEFALQENYPNPFNPETIIRFAVPQTAHVVIEVYDLLGREVARLVDGEMAAGHHTVVFDGRGLASGIYVYRMFSESFEQHRTMLLVK